MAELTLEQKKAMAKARARMRAQESSAEPQGQDGSGPSGFMPFLNKAIATTAGAPVDLTNAVLGVVGLDSDIPFGGSDSIRAGMEKIGAPTPDRDPENFTETLGQVSGEAATFGLAGLKGAQLLSQAPKMTNTTTGRIANTINRAAVERPGATLATEGGAVLGAAGGREAARENELSPGMGALAEVGGALVGGGLTTIPTLTGAVTKASARQGKRAALTFTEKGAFDRASARVQEVVANPETAARKIQDLKGTNLLPASRTDDPGLMTLEEAVFSRDPAESTRIARKTADSVQDLVGKIQQSGDVSAPRKFLQAKRERLFAALDARVEQAGEDVVRALEIDDSMLDTQNIQAAARESLESALSDAKAQEALLWGAIPENTKVSVARTKNAIRSLEQSLSVAQKSDMPEVARRVLRANQNTKAAKWTELDGLYKKLGETATQARANKDFNQARIAEQIREAILEDLGSPVGGGPEVNASLQTARAFSKQINDKFRKGTVGKIMGFAREGGGKVPAERALEVSVGVGGTRGALAGREIQKAAPDEITLDAIQSYMRRRFMENVIDVKDGEEVFNGAKASSFLRKHSETLNDFPVLKQQLLAARSADDVARRVKSSAEAFKKKLDKPSVSSTALFLNGPLDSEISAVMKTRNPSKNMNDLIRSAKRAPNKREVLDGLRAGYSQWLIDSSTSRTATDIAGNLRVNGARMKAMLQNADNREILGSLYTKEQQESIERYADELARMANQSKFKGRSMPIINDLPSKMIELPARYLGAKLATAFTSGNAGTSLQAAQMGSKQMQALLRKMNVGRAEQIIIDAMEDPDLMKALLLNQRTASPQARGKAQRKIRAWIGGVGQRLIEDEEEE